MSEVLNLKSRIAAGEALLGTFLKTPHPHIVEVLADTGFNISETARRLGMHRRTLARKLEKRRIV